MTDQNLEVCWLRLEQLRQKQEAKHQYWSDVKTGVASALLSVAVSQSWEGIIPHLKEGIKGNLMIYFFEFFPSK